MAEDVKTDVVPEVVVSVVPSKEIKEEIKDSFSIFVEEKDTFDVTVEYYNHGSQYFVKGIDSGYDDKQPCQKLIVTLSYPSMATFSTVARSEAASKIGIGDEFSYQSLMGLQMVRLFSLVRSWNYQEPCSNDLIMKLRPKVIKAILDGITVEIAMEGII